MKTFNEWIRDRKDESWFGGMFGAKKQEPQTQEPQAQKYTSRAYCPFCKSSSAVIIDDLAMQGTKYWHCTKCHREWHLSDAETPDATEPGYGATFLPRNKVAHMGSPSNLPPGLRSESNLKALYLSGLISEETYYEVEQQTQAASANQQQDQQVDINQVASQMQFQPTSKKKLMYQYVQSTENMPAMSYTVAQQQMPVVTNTADGKETQNTADANDIIMSGPSREQYVIKAAKFPKLYVGQLGGPIHPEQSPRNVSLYTGNKPVTFTASWGESMVLKPGDYLVKEGEGKYYRIAKHEYELTYNAPGKVG